jgi:hypothetical protein
MESLDQEHCPRDNERVRSARSAKLPGVPRLSEKSPSSTERTEPSPGDGRANVSVVLPTFNEKDNIVPLVEELRSRFRAGGYSYEILVIDDQSPDGTASLVATAFADDPGVRVTVRRKNYSGFERYYSD